MPNTILPSDEPGRDLALVEDEVIPGEWRVEYFDDDGDDYVRDYRDAIKEGRLGNTHRGCQSGSIAEGVARAEVSALIPMCFTRQGRLARIPGTRKAQRWCARVSRICGGI